MNKFLNKVLVLILLMSSVLIGSQKETNNIAQISAVSLYNIDKVSLQATINIYIKNNPTIKALKIVEDLSQETYISIYRNEKGETIKGSLPLDIKSLNHYSSISKYESEKVGEVVAYFENGDLVKLTNNEKEWLDSHKITLSVDNRYAPMNFINLKGEMDGLSIDYIKLIEKKIGYPISLDSNTWPISLKNAMDHKSDGIINANSTPQREEKLIFTKSYITVPMVLITASSDKDYSSLSELKNKTILVKEKTVEATVLPQKYPLVKIKEIKTYKDALMMVSSGKADGVFGHMAVLEYERNQYLISNIKKNFVSFNDVTTEQAIGIRKTAPLLKDILDKAINSITKEESRKINEKWMKPLKKDSKNLSKKEITWLKQHPSITLAVIDNYPPYDFRDEDNKLAGFHTEIINIMNRNLGININIKPFNSWSEAYSSAINGSVNGILSLSWSREREEKYFIYSSPYHFSPYYLVAKKDNTEILTLENLGNKTIAVEQDTIFKNIVEEKAPNANILFVKDTKEAYKSVEEGKALATISPNINDQDYKDSDLKIVSEVYHKSSNLYAGINKKQPIVASIVTKAIDSISLKDITKLRQKWFTKTNAIIELNENEKKWIKKNPEIKVIKFFDEPPFTLNGNKKSGYVYELVEYLIKSAGLKIKYVDGLNSYGDMLDSLDKGQVDILTTFPTSLSLGQDSNIVKSKFVLKTPFILIGTSNNKNIKSIKELFGKKVAVVKGYMQDTYLNAFPEIKKYYVNNNEDGFAALRSGKAQYYINNKANSEYVLNKSFATDLKIVYELPYDNFPPLSISFAMNGQKKTLVSILNKALDQVPYKKIKDIRDKWIITNQQKTQEIIFSEEERKWIESNPIIKIAITNYWIDHDNINTDVIKLLNKYGKLNILLIKYDTWKGAYNDTIKGINSHAILNLSWSKERAKKYFHYTKPYNYSPSQLIINKNNTDIKSIKDLHNKTVYIREKAITKKILEEEIPSSKIVEIKDETVMFDILSKSKKPEAILDYTTDRKKMEKYNLKIIENIYDKYSQVSIGVSHNQAILSSILDKIYKNIPKEELLELQNKVYKKEKKKAVLSFTIEEKEWLTKNPAIRLAYMNYWPTNNSEKNIHTEYINLLSKYGNVNITLVKYDHWKNGFDAASIGKDVFGILNLSWSKQREKEKFDYTKPYFFTPAYLIVKEDDNSIRSLEDLKNGKILLKEKSITNQIIKESKYSITPINLENEDEIHKALGDETSEAQALLTYVNDPELLEKYDLKIANKLFSKYGEVHIGISKNKKILLSIMNKIYDVVPKNELTKIQNKTYKKASKVRVKLTKKEKDFIKNNKVIRVHNEKNWPPFNFYEFGQAKGYSVELMKQVAKNTGLNIEFISGPTWDEFLTQMKKGELDVMINIVENEEREKYMLFSDPFLRATMGVATHKENESIQNFKDMLDKKVAVEKGFFYHDFFNKNHPDTKLHVVNDGLQTLQSVAFKQADSTLGFIPVMKYIAEKNFINDLRYFTDTSSPIMQPMPLRFSTRKDTPELLSILQKGLASITPEQQKELSEKWLTSSENKDSIKIDLTKKEQEWIDKKIPIKYVYDSDWAPFEWKNELNEHTGIIYDILRIVSERTGIKLDPVPTENWSQAVDFAESKQVDMYGGLGENVDRKKYMNFTKNILYKTPYVFVVHKDNENDHFDTFNSLKNNEKIAVVDGYTIHGIMKDKQPKVNLITVPSVMDGFTQLSNKKIDIFLVNASTAKYYLNRKGFDDLKIATKTEYRLEIKSAIRDDWPPEVISIIDKALDSIDEKELADIYLKWTEVLVEKKIDWDLIYQISSIALILILLGAYWNRRLKRAVDEKTDELQKLLESFDENVIASKTNKKGIIQYASKAFCEISGYSQDELVGQPQNIVRHPDMSKEVFKDLWSTIHQGKIWKGEVKNKKKNGGFYWVEAIVTPKFDSKNEIIGFSAIRHDITSKKEVEELSANLEIKVKERTSELHESKERFELTVSGSGDGLWEYNSQTDENWFSPLFKEMLGYTDEELPNTLETWKSCVHKDDIDGAIDAFVLHLEKDIPYDIEYRMKRKDNHHIWVRARAKSLRDENGKALRTSGSVTDITSLKKAQEEIKESQKRFVTLFDAAPDSIAIIKDGKYINCNQKTLELFGVHSVQEFKESKPSDYSPEFQDTNNRSDKLASEQIQKAIKHGYNRFEWIHKNIANNQDFYAEVILSSIKLGGEDHIYAVVRDISERKKAQEEIKEQSVFIDSIMNAQENFVITSDGKVLRTANKAFFNFYNINNTDQFLEKYGDCICDTFDKDAPKEYIQKMMGEEVWLDYIYNRPSDIHKAMIQQDGKEFIFRITTDKLVYKGEELKTAVFSDITELEKIRKDIELILSNILLPILITSKNSRKILYANKYAQRQYERPLEDIIGSDIDDVYSVVNQQNHILEELQSKGYVENSEEVFKTHTGKKFDALLSVTPLVYRDEDAYIGMVVDITKQKEIEKQIRDIHKQTRDSIEYASLIQQAIVPDNQAFNNYFKDFFTIWNPKDIVGGDIYLFEELRNKDECLLMAIDCTGHGVPGAFVTMLVKAIERQIAAKIAADENINVSPAWILGYFNKTMKKLLKQENDESISNAGFDGGVIYYNKKKNIIKYSGAETPLFYIENDELKMIKGCRHSIGYKKSDATFEFKEHIIELKENMHFYLTTDGYLDQNGGAKGFCMGKTKFKNIINENYKKDFSIQKEKFLEFLNEYQGSQNRNDDVTVIGFKI
jgi:PAS domain S-box-containing protein